MNCPKCGAESYLVDEEFGTVTEKVTPPKLIIKATFACKSCYEKFSRIIVHNLDAKTEGMAGTDTINKVLGDLNFPESQTKVDTSVLDEMSSFDPAESDRRRGDKPRLTDI